jgi:hypothetical protein
MIQFLCLTLARSPMLDAIAFGTSEADRSQQA